MNTLYIFGSYLKILIKKYFKNKFYLLLLRYFQAFKSPYYIAILLFPYQLNNQVGFLAICQWLHVSEIVYIKLSSEPAQLSPTL